MAHDSSLDEVEDDYLTMAIEEPSKTQEKETYSQRRVRKAREAEAKRPKSKAALAAEHVATREKELSKKLDESNKGFKMLKMMGFKEGMALGKADDGPKLSEPICLDFKEDRGGIGLGSEKKRAFEEEVEKQVKRVKEDQEGYRERIRQDRENGRLEAQVHAAQKVAEKLDTDADEETLGSLDVPDIDVAGQIQKATRGSKSTSQINLLWRGLVRARESRDREKRARHDMIQSLSRLPTYEDTEKNADDKLAYGFYEEDVEQEDSDLDEFIALPPEERLLKVVTYLRETYQYCFWCKYRYPDSDTDGCPGLTEEDHD